MAIFILWYVGKRIEVRLNKRTENDHNGEIDKNKELEKRRSINEIGMEKGRHGMG